MTSAVECYYTLRPSAYLCDSCVLVATFNAETAEAAELYSDFLGRDKCLKA